MIIRNTTVLDFATLSRRTGVDVLVLENRVQRIAPGLAGTSAASGESIDGTGLYLIPGLVNTHCHAAMTLLRGAAEDCLVEDWFNRHIWMYERSLAPEDVYWGTLLAAAEMLLAGVTCVADHYFHMDQAFRACEESGIRADLAWAVFGVGDGWERQVAEAMDFTTGHRDANPRIAVSLGPHSPYICPASFLSSVADKAEALGLKMHIHVSEEKGQVERSLSEKGRTPVQVLADTGVLRPGTILAHAYHSTDEDLALIRDKGAGIAHCAKTYMKFGDVRDFLPRALAAGVRVGLGTDGPASNSTLSIFETARCAALLAKSAVRDARAARIGEILPLCHAGGEVLGLAGYGRLEEGSLADLVLLDPRTPSMVPEHDVFANILYSLGERNVHTVIVDGKVLVREGRLLHLDMEELRRRAAGITARLVAATADRPMQRY
jgi:5-methylthioadenosine/S-adenosylhomocysteine deaminase